MTDVYPNKFALTMSTTVTTTASATRRSSNNNRSNSASNSNFPRSRSTDSVGRKNSNHSANALDGSSHHSNSGHNRRSSSKPDLSKASSSISNKSSSSCSSSSARNRPRRITMAGMIYDANQSLERALDPKTSGLHPGLFNSDLLGIGFYTVWEAGLIFSGNVGTGIVFARNPTNGTWSAPAAVGLSGIGWGLMGGASRKSIVYLIYDYFTLQSMSGENGAMLRAQAESSLGFWGRSAEASAIVSARGVGTNIALSYSRGIFGGISIEGALCKGRNRVNERFYGEKVSTGDILFSGNPRDFQEGTLLPEVYNKLQSLCEGLSIYTPSPEERMRVKSTRQLVDKEGEEALKEEVIEYTPIPTEYQTQQQPATDTILEESSSNEIEISENMDIFADLVDKEDALHPRPLGLGVPPPSGWPYMLNLDGVNEQTTKLLQNVPRVDLSRLGHTSSAHTKEHNAMTHAFPTGKVSVSDSAITKMREGAEEVEVTLGKMRAEVAEGEANADR